MTPAALSAALNGDFANALIASTPGGIEAQEAAGQASMVAASHLPRLVRGAGAGTTIQFVAERLGITLGAVVDDLFVEAILPDGWKMAPSSHSMHSDLVDGQGRARAGIFYKAAFYDRRADLRLNCRYTRGYGYGEGNLYRAKVLDSATGQELFRTETAGDSDYEAAAVLDKQADAWLDEHFPLHRDCFAYWD